MPAIPANQFLTPQKPGRLALAFVPKLKSCDIQDQDLLLAVTRFLVPAISANQFLTPQKPGRLVRARKPQITAQATQRADSYTRSNNRRFNIQRCLTADSYTGSNNRRLTSNAVSQSNTKTGNIQGDGRNILGHFVRILGHKYHQNHPNRVVRSE